MLTNGINLEIVKWEAHKPWPEEISIDGAIYSNSRCSAEHGYSWRSSAGGNVIFFKGDNGKIESFPLTKLRRVFEHDKKAEVAHVEESR